MKDPADDSAPRMIPPASPLARRMAWIGRWAGPLLGVFAFGMLARDVRVSDEAAATGGLATWMAVWWMTEAVPLGITALLPLALLPLLGVYGEPSRTNHPIKIAAAPYADPAIFLFLGGFFLALSVERWGLHRRVALLTRSAVGAKPAAIVGGFIAATALLSMWISNTATALMMLPIALSIVKLIEENGRQNRPAADATDTHHFAASLALAVAYAASIGGCVTLVGTPPNTYFRGFAHDNGFEIDFGRWMLFSAPLALLYLVLCWWLLTRWVFPVKFAAVAGGKELLRRELAALGPMTRGEWIVLVVFLCTAAAWISHGPLGDALPGAAGGMVRRLDDASIAILASIVLFVLPVDRRRGLFALDSQAISRVPWQVLLMFGGGLSLSEAIRRTELADYLGGQLALLGMLPTPVLLVLMCLAINFFTELTSNVATIATVLPIVLKLAGQLDLDPMFLMIPCTLSASYAFMLPAGTPPNAIAYGTGRVSIGEMMRAGVCLNLLGALLVPLAVYTLGWLVIQG
jgi:solute carrier family 13 (sodium-dependent dicarboxylate transporter), member 2/3/5